MQLFAEEDNVLWYRFAFCGRSTPLLTRSVIFEQQLLQHVTGTVLIRTEFVPDHLSQSTDFTCGSIFATRGDALFTNSSLAGARFPCHALVLITNKSTAVGV